MCPHRDIVNTFLNLILSLDASQETGIDLLFENSLLRTGAKCPHILSSFPSSSLFPLAFRLQSSFLTSSKLGLCSSYLSCSLLVSFSFLFMREAQVGCRCAEKWVSVWVSESVCVAVLWNSFIQTFRTLLWQIRHWVVDDRRVTWAGSLHIKSESFV